MSEVRSGQARQSRSGGARRQLILAAEQYFALRGFIGASLKDIQEAAGQRNASAVHYHFGSRDQLIEAILDYRIPPYADKRLARMEMLERKRGSLTMRDVVAAWIRPLAEELRPRPDGNYYIRFLDQLRRNGPVEVRARAANLQLIGYGAIFDLLMKQMPAASQRLNRSRLALTAELILSSLAQLEAALPADEARPEDYPALAVSNLVDYAAAGLAAEPDAETVALERSSTSGTDFHFSFHGPLT
ncbi:MAG: TetR/AcrR family transcriptional regulator [Novosphingobium sp.]|nr:TetR/AcrR family transcriptional regulator [Novosphingobium sp.]